jgi:hypothetical protein
MTNAASWNSPTAELNKLLQAYPLLCHAHDLIRSSRSPLYIEMVDKFVTSWSMALAITCDIGILAGNNMIVALDSLIESCSCQQELEMWYELVRDLATVDGAMFYLGEQNEPIIKMSLEDAAKIHVAFITAAGYRRLQTHADPGLAQKWLKVWQQSLDRHMNQQCDHTFTTLARATYHPEVTSGAIEDYLNRFGGSTGLVLAVISVLPFSRIVSEELLHALNDLSLILESLFRLVQDTWYDPDEKLSLSVYIVAAEYGCSIEQAHKLIRQGQCTSLETRLKDAETAFFAKTAQNVQQLLEQYEHSTIHGTLVQFSEILFKVAHKLSAVCQQMHANAPN